MSVLFVCTLDNLLTEEIKLTTKIFKPMTYGTNPIRIRNNIFNKELSFKSPNTEVKAHVNIETGEVIFLYSKKS